MDGKLLLVYCTTIFIASIIPGPSTLLALSQGNKFGLAAGTLSAIGNVVASVVQGIVALLVVVEIGYLSPTLLWVIKIVGAAYIIYLGISLFGVRDFGKPPDAAACQQTASPLKHLWDGFAFAIFNPKALTFFAALFPQFLNGDPVTAQTVTVIFAPIILIAFACFMLYVAAGRMLFSLLGASAHTGKVLGGCIVLAGASLLFT